MERVINIPDKQMEYIKQMKGQFYIDGWDLIAALQNSMPLQMRKDIEPPTAKQKNMLIIFQDV